jgi:hypothetical protein
MTNLVQRIEAALASDDLHSGEVIGLIASATASEDKLHILIKQLRLLLDALTAKEAAARRKPLSNDAPGTAWFNEPKPPPHQRQQSRR